MADTKVHADEELDEAGTMGKVGQMGGRGSAAKASNGRASTIASANPFDLKKRGGSVRRLRKTKGKTLRRKKMTMKQRQQQQRQQQQRQQQQRRRR
jgi:hypothetical protein